MRVATARAARTTRALWWGWKAEFSGAAEYRADLISGTVVSAAWLALSVAPALVVSDHTKLPGGWTLSRLMYLQAIWYLSDAMLWMIIVPNCRRWSDAATNGTLDTLLLRPVNSLVLCSLGTIYVQDVPKVVLGFGLAIGAVIAGHGAITATTVLASIVAIACAVVLMWAAGVLANYKALSQVQFDGMFVLQAAHNLARVPTPFYGATVHVILTVVVPVSFLATVPTQLLFGAVSPLWLLAALGVGASAILVTSGLWQRELRHYTGAMG